jgi:hypothetical protein
VCAVCNDVHVTEPNDVVRDRSPRLDARRFVCPRCDAFADQSWSNLARTNVSAEGILHDTTRVVERFDGQLALGGDGAWQTSKCASCGDLTVWRNGSIVFPHTSTIPVASKDTPSDVLALYDEGRAVWPISRRAGAALARAALEKMLRSDPSALKKDDLITLISKAKPTLPSHVGSLLDVVRHAGNKSLHVEDEPDDVMVLVLDEGNTEIGPLIFEAINLLVDERVTKPAAVEALFDGLPQGVKDSINRRAQEDKDS